MVVRVTGAGAAAQAVVEGADDLRSLSVRLGPGGELGGAQLDGIVDRESDTHVRIDLGWLRAAAGYDDPARGAGFDQMVQYAEAQGWVDAAGRVRAHLEPGSAA